MPFDSYFFVLLFLPFFVIVWRVAALIRPENLGLVLLGFSLLFCLWASPAALLLFVCLIAVNYLFGMALTAPGERAGSLRRRGLLGTALLVNFAPLIVLRAAPLIAGAAAELAGGMPLLGALLPELRPEPAGAGPFMLETAKFAGLSFFALIQSAWLVAIYQRHIEPEGLVRHYAFSLAFPYLLAGPIVRYEQMGPQLDALRAPSFDLLARGLGLFVTGLAKKVLLADWLGGQADAAFAAVQSGLPLSQPEAWIGTLAFSLEIYFDFSAYADMATGAGAMIGLRLPENFASPYRATGFIEFWRRWHITFSSWLRACVYEPLAGRWPGRGRLVLGIVAAMLFAGLWHGSALTFLVWALVHGVLVGVNTVTRLLKNNVLDQVLASPPVRVLCCAVTFALITLSWVLFRSADIPQALEMYSLLLGLSADTTLAGGGLLGSWTALAPLVIGLVTVFVLPASRDVFLGRRDGGRAWLSFFLTSSWALILAFAALACLLLMDKARPFIF